MVAQIKDRLFVVGHLVPQQLKAKPLTKRVVVIVANSIIGQTETQVEPQGLKPMTVGSKEHTRAASSKGLILG